MHGPNKAATGDECSEDAEQNTHRRGNKNRGEA